MTELIITSQLQAERGRKGGQQSTPAKQFVKIKYCTNHCPLFPCFCQGLSKTQYNGECALKKFPDKIQTKTLRLMTEGETGFNKQIMDMLLDYSNEVQAMPRHKVYIDKEGIEHRVPSNDYLTFIDKLVNTSIKLKDSVYGTKSSINMAVNPYDEVIKDLKLEKEKKD